MIFVYAVYSLLYSKKRSKVFNSKQFTSIILFFLIFGYAFILSVFSNYGSLGFNGIHITVVPFLLYIALAIYPKKINLKSILLNFLLVGGFVMLIGFYFYFSKPLIYGHLLVYYRALTDDPVYAAQYSRMVSIILSPNIFATFAGVFVIVLIYLLSITKRKVVVIFSLIFAILGIVALILSMSRGAWVAATISIIYIIIRQFKFKSIKTLLIPIIIIAGILLINDTNYFQLIEKRFDSLLDLSNSSSYGRIQIWIDALSRGNRIIYGYGLGVGGINLIHFPELSQLLGIEVLDGYYIKVLVEVGIIGFIIWALHMMLIWPRVYKDYDKNLIVLSQTVLIFYLIQSIGSNVLDFIVVAPLLWIILGITARKEKAFDVLII
ncbi:O-antigen ligase family protein [Acholeplasma hippikon]|nr:O-antigen ligase family protein [Acholeplasma hippikon]